MRTKTKNTTHDNLNWERPEMPARPKRARLEPFLPLRNKRIPHTFRPGQIAFYRTFHLVLVLLNGDQSSSLLSWMKPTKFPSVWSAFFYPLHSYPLVVVVADVWPRCLFATQTHRRQQQCLNYNHLMQTFARLIRVCACARALTHSRST